MRVLAVTAGCDRSEKAIFQGMARAGVALDMVCDPSTPYQGAFGRAGIRVRHQIVRHRLDHKAIWAIRKRLCAHRYDLVYAPRNHSLSVSLLAARGLNLKHVAYRGTSGHLSRLDPASWLTYLNPGIHRIICVSHSVRRYLLSMGLPPGRLITIHKGHDLGWYTDHKPVDLARFGIPQNAFVVGFVGNMRPVKGVDFLLKSMRHIPTDSPVHLVLVGKVQDKKIETLAAHPAIRHRVHLTGFHPQAATMASAFDVFVMPSIKREGLPRAVIEAMAQGVPSVVTDVGGMPEIVVDGESGLVVPPRDPQALARAFISLAQNPSLRRRLGENGRVRIRDYFNIETTIAQTINLFQQLAKPL